MPVSGGRAGDRTPAGPLRRGLAETLRCYKYWISPLLPSACRFHPTCSEYMREAVLTHGAVRGLWLGVRRLLKCHPLHPGGVDPVPNLNERT